MGIQAILKRKPYRIESLSMLAQDSGTYNHEA